MDGNKREQKLVRINVTIDQNALNQLDHWADRLGLSRSALIREAVRHYRPWPGAVEESEPRRSPEAVMALVESAADTLGDIDAVSLIRRDRDRR